MEISQRPELLEICSHDETLDLQAVFPLGVIQPKATQDVQEAARYATQNKIPITARGAGTGKAGACVPTPGALVIDFSGMDQILEINSDNLTARVQPGVILNDFKQALETQRLFYPPDPNSLQSCTLGGNFATNAAGPSALKYGSTRDYVLGLEVVLASGEIMRLGKNTVKGVAGYDLVSLLCGSEGTLGLVTELTLKLLPAPQTLQTALLRFDTNEHALEAVLAILAAGYLPRALEYMDALCMGGTPALMVECDGGENLEALAANLLGLEDTQVALDNQQHRALWEHRRLMSVRLRTRRKHKISEDIVVPRNKILIFTQHLEQLGLKHDVETAAFGHAGDGNLHAQIMFDRDLEPHKIDSILRELFGLTVGLGGTISGEHGIGLAKKAFLPLEQSLKLIEFQKAIKKVWDPDNILNPDKIF